MKLCQALRAQHGFNAIILMPTNLYGTGDQYHATHSNVMSALIRRFTEAVEGATPASPAGSAAPPPRVPARG